MFHYYVTKLINTKIMLTSDLVNKQDPITRDTKGFKNNLVDPYVLVLLYLQTYIIGICFLTIPMVMSLYG